MPGTTHPPSESGIFNRTLERVERVERVTTPTSPRPSITENFSYPGILAANIESPPWYAPQPGTIQLVRVSLLANASTNHVIELRINGAPQQQFTLTTGNKTVVSACSYRVNIGDYVTIKTITVADANMTVTLSLS